ncbi:MAG: MFS transporter [Pseudomonadota bacterium]
MPPAARWALASLSLSMLLSSLGTSIANVGLPSLALAFDASFQKVQWVVLAYLLAIATLIVGAGRLGDLLGRRQILLAGIAMFTAGSALCGGAPTLEWLIAARVLQGVGAALMLALTMAFIGETVPKEKSGSAMGLLGTMSASGTALGPALGGLLISGYGWRAIFLVNVPLGIATYLLARWHLPADRDRSTPVHVGFDTLGTFLLAVSLGAYALAVTWGRGTFGSVNLVLLMASVFALAVFIAAERRASEPLLRLTLFRDRSLNASLGSSALVATVMMATLVVGPFYLSGALGLAPAGVGMALSIGPLAVAFTGVPAGHLVDRIGAARMTLAGLIAMAGGCALLAVLPLSSGVAGYVLPMVAVTIGYGVFQTANNTSVMAGIPADRRGVISGMLNLSRNLGLITGASVMGAVFALASGSGPVTAANGQQIAAGMQATYTVAGLLVGVAILLVWWSSKASRARSI